MSGRYAQERRKPRIQAMIKKDAMDPEGMADLEAPAAWELPPASDITIAKGERKKHTSHDDSVDGMSKWQSSRRSLHP
ncbi:unnamed protein product [Arabis nemorensis]|uniref:Uncharacterized protein n=1 Tax=Arabis nemorensis TaxID=586526 RepID=A0A565CBJ5_9BRAS|nr:unnamed protein product [Arabis nemorensis]